MKRLAQTPGSQMGLHNNIDTHGNKIFPSLDEHACQAEAGRNNMTKAVVRVKPSIIRTFSHEEYSRKD